MKQARHFLSFLFVIMSIFQSIDAYDTQIKADAVEPGFIQASEGNYIYLNNVEDPVTMDELKGKLIAHDDFDGDITSGIKVDIDNYTENIDVLGDHIIVFSITDSSNATSYIVITVRNVDIGKPRIILDVESSLRIPQYSHLGSNLPRISAIDGYEGNLTSKLNITGLDAIDTNVLGQHTLLYTVTDSSGNTTSETFIVEVVDSTFPEIIGPETIIKRTDVILDGTFYLKYFTAEDDHDGIISPRVQVIEDGYTGHANDEGKYIVIVSVTDNAGNETKHTLYIEVKDDITPQLIIDNYYWVVENNQKITDQMFIQILQSVSDLPKYEYVFTTTYDNYSSYYQTNNIYQKSFELLSETGEEFERDIILEVVPSGSNVIEAPPTFIESNSGLIIGIVASALFVGLILVGVFSTKK